MPIVSRPPVKQNQQNQVPTEQPEQQEEDSQTEQS